jgi:Zn-dependent peptidase ImmA (M78 family)/transcriptional regulator with XRE-family HTH domain
MAPRVEALIKPELLVWARSTAGFSLAEVGEKLRLERDRIDAWEVGNEAPSIPQLRKLAELYRRPLAVFYLQAVPAAFQVIRDLRRLPGAGFRRLPPDLLLEVRRASQHRALALELLDEAGEQPPAFALSALPTDEPEAVGGTIRAALGITPDVQARWRDADGRTAFNEWRSRIESVDVLVFQTTRVAPEDASGFALAEEVLPVIGVNRKDAPTRRTFSLLHELAHLMLRVSGVSDLDTDAARPPEDQSIEVFCNQVTAAALIPRDILLGDPRVAQHGGRSAEWADNEISDLSRSFGVSREALLRRLLTFGRTTDEFYRRKRAQYAAEFQVQRERQRSQPPEEGIPRNMPRETVSNYGRPLVRIVLENYYQNKADFERGVGVARN